MEALIVGLIITALVALVVSVVQISGLTILAIRQPGIGRILFLSITSLKAWAAAFLVLTLLFYFFPNLASRQTRLLFNTGLALYLVLQPIVVNIAVYRWKHEQED